MTTSRKWIAGFFFSHFITSTQLSSVENFSIVGDSGVANCRDVLNNGGDVEFKLRAILWECWLLFPTFGLGACCPMTVFSLLLKKPNQTTIYHFPVLHVWTNQILKTIQRRKLSPSQWLGSGDGAWVGGQGSRAFTLSQHYAVVLTIII